MNTAFSTIAPIRFFHSNSPSGGSATRPALGGHYVTTAAPRSGQVGSYVTTSAHRAVRPGSYVTTNAKPSGAVGSYVSSVSHR